MAEDTPEQLGTPVRTTVVRVGDCGVDQKVQATVKEYADRVGKSVRRTVEEAWELGRALEEAKRQVRHGYWIPWVEQEVGLDARMAQRYMDLYKKDPQKRQMSHLKSVAHASRALLPAETSKREAKGARARAGKAASRKAVSKRSGPAEEDLAVLVPRLEEMLTSTSATAVSQRAWDVGSLVKLAVVALDAADRQIRSATGNERDLVSLSEESVEKLRGALEALIGRQRNGRAS